MIRDLAILLACQLAGEVVVRSAGSPVPGPVLGMMLLVGVLVVLDRFAGDRAGATQATASLAATADRLLGALGLLFVPAGVGVIRHLDLLAEHGAALGTALVASVIATLLVAVSAFRLTSRLFGDTTGSVGPDA